MPKEPMSTFVAGGKEFEVVDKKLRDAFVTPEMFGAVGDGVTDDTEALRECFSKRNGIISFKNGRTYLVSSSIHIHDSTVVEMNSAKIKATCQHLFFNFDPDDIIYSYSGEGNIVIRNGTIEGGAISFIHAKNILIDNVDFVNCLNHHMLEICACKYYTIRNCRFIGVADLSGTLEYINIDPCYSSNFPWLNNESSYDKTPNDHIIIDGCYFSLGEDQYAHGSDAIGVHSGGESKDSSVTIEANNHSNIIITNNTIENFSEYALRINCMDNVIVSNNFFTYPSAYAIELGRFFKEDNVTIINNIFKKTGSNAADVLIRNDGITNLSFYGNSMIHNRATDPSVLYCLNFNNTDFSLRKTDRFYIGGSANIESISTGIPITALNLLEIHTGGVSLGTYERHKIHSYNGRNFVVGETYRILCDDGSHSPVYKLVTIGTDSISCEVPMRAVYASKI